MTARRVWAEIDLDAVRNNARLLRSRLAPTTRLLGVVKADAYGHGSVPVSRALLHPSDENSAASCSDYIRFEPNHLGCDFRVAFGLSLRGPALEDQVASFDVPENA